MLNDAAARFLLTEPGRALLDEAAALHAAQSDTLRALTRLRRSASPEQAAAAWEMAGLRTRAIPKFGASAAGMLFTAEALEQATGTNAADYHAGRFAGAGMTRVLDLTGGIGGDALAFARAGLTTTLYELDPVRALFAAHNARACGLAERVTVVNGDAQDALGTLGAQGTPGSAVWLDPARRSEGRRVAGPEDYSPPLSILRELAARGINDIGVKAASAIDHAAAADYGAELEFLSDNGECKEALLWRGTLRRGDGLTRATLLTADGPQTLSGLPDSRAAASDSTVPNARFLLEPDPAVIRAHLVGTLARQLGACLVDPQIAYLLAPAFVPTPFAAAYAVLDTFPYQRRRLQDALTARDAGRVVVKKRGFPLEPDAVRAQLKLKGARELTVILTRRGDAHWVFVCQPA